MKKETAGASDRSKASEGQMNAIINVFDGASCDESRTTAFKDLSRRSKDKLRFLARDVASYWRDGARWVRRLMIIDRDHGRYIERVTDPVTGETIHSCEEVLSAHRGHGSASKRTASRQVSSPSIEEGETQ